MGCDCRNPLKVFFMCWAIIGLLCGFPGWQIVDWYFDIEATQEYLCMSKSNSSININDTNVNQTGNIGSWYGPLAVANWFTTPFVLLLTFYICCDFMSNTIFNQKYGLVGFGYFSMEGFGGGKLVEVLEIKRDKFSWKNVVLFFPMFVVNVIWLFIFNYLVLWLALWHEWVMSIDELCHECGILTTFRNYIIDHKNRKRFTNADNIKATDGVGKNYNLLSKHFPIKRNRLALYKFLAIPEKIILICLSFLALYLDQRNGCNDDDQWKILASGICAIKMIIVTIHNFIRLYRAV